MRTGITKKAPECVEYRLRGVNEINERFNHRLPGKVIWFAKDYADRRFRIVLYLHWSGEPNTQGMALCLDGGLG